MIFSETTLPGADLIEHEPRSLQHPFQMLAEDIEVYYQMSEYYSPDWVCGAGWDVPAFRIEWPSAERRISPRDLQFPEFTA